MIIKNKVPISNAEGLKILSDKMKKRELAAEQQQAYDFLKDTVKLKESQAAKLKGELADFGLAEEEVLNILNILPSDETLLKLILKEEKDQKKETLKKILDIVSKYA
ncbi:MAG: hypothetical protein JW727_04750 [Candidatus Aenigmarchaeota archaeon]|nr:hypothetical protein [Candidatus Aenigmarchaeota archaeon]